MEDVYRVAIHHDNDCGYIEYDFTAKSITVALDNPAKRKAVEDYLGTEHTVLVVGDRLLDLRQVTGKAGDDVELLKRILTKLWENTGVLVDWSRPVGVK